MTREAVGVVLAGPAGTGLVAAIDAIFATTGLVAVRNLVDPVETGLVPVEKRKVVDVVRREAVAAATRDLNVAIHVLEAAVADPAVNVLGITIVAVGCGRREVVVAAG